LGITDDKSTEFLGDRIARLRRSKGWNQGELGKRLGLRAAQVSRCERGVQLPSVDLLPRLSHVLGVSIDYLMTGHSFGEAQRDYRIRERLDDLESLPEPQRNHLVEFLDALISAQQMLRKFRERKAAAETRDAEARRQRSRPAHAGAEARS
jgi:transcriptional regulator with XRE-family HTH domain